MNFSWTPERVDLLKKLWIDGLSASQIAVQLGAVSRNSVIGKIYREGLSQPRAAPSAIAASRSRATHLPPYLSRSNLQSHIPVDAPFCSFGDEPEPKRAIATTAEFILPRPLKKKEKIIVSPPDSSFRCTLIELTQTSCRWPIGDPGKPDFRFCGAKMREGAKLSYCPYHDAMAYRPPGSKADESKAAA